MSLIKQFQGSPENGTSFLYSAKGGLAMLAIQPQASFQGNLSELPAFVSQHRDKLIVGYISYDASLDQHQVYSRHQAKDRSIASLKFHAYAQWQEEIIPTQTPKRQKFSGADFQERVSQAKYEQAYHNIKQHIQKGDIYQVNLTHQLQGSSQKNSQDLFLDLIASNPVDFMSYLGFADYQILSASPERFIRIAKGEITTRPIKGTIAKTDCPIQNQAQIQALLNCPKEKAELNMITDLLRNDLGQVCHTGTVRVKSHRSILECPNIYHTYSEIQGKLKMDPVQALISMLPAGSISGCPKKRSLAIIDEQEHSARGIYTGVIGYIHPTGILDFSIAIRTLLKKGSQVTLGVGGGIVHDSKLKNEYAETLQKAKSFRNIL